MDLKDIESVRLIVWFVVPGLVALYFRAQFTTGVLPAQADAILPCIALSMICFVVGQPISQYFLPPPTSRWYLAGSLVVLLAVPAIIGILLGLGAQQGWIRRAQQALRMKPVHHMPSSWDYKFAELNAGAAGKGGAWVAVTLKDGAVVLGFFGGQSFASSTERERDLYLELTCDPGAGAGDKWIPRGSGMFIPGSVIRTVEFWPNTPRA